MSARDVEPKFWACLLSNLKSSFSHMFSYIFAFIGLPRQYLLRAYYVPGIMDVLGIQG